MTLSEELAESREQVPQPTTEDLIESARWHVTHPDTGFGQRILLKALLSEIDRLRARCQQLMKMKVVS